MRGPMRIAALAVVAAALLAHARGLGGGFVYDDHRFVEANPAIATLAHVGRFFTDPATASAGEGVEPDVYRPLRTLSFAVDRALFALEPFGWHLASVALHVVASLLVLRLLVRLLAPVSESAPRRRAGLVAAAIGACVFAAHPVTVEAVAWVSSRGDVLALVLLLLALEATERPGVLRTALGAALLLLACFAKESAVIGFLLVPLRDLALPARERPPRRATALHALAFLAVVAGYVAWRVHVLPPAKDLPWLAQTAFPDGSRAAAARGMLAGIAQYARALVWPAGFPFDRNVFTDPVPASWGDPGVVLGAGVLATLLLGGGVALARRRGVAALACLGPLVALLPVSNVVVPLKAFTADRFLYPALPFVALGVGAALLAALRRAPASWRVPIGVASAAAVAALALVSAARTGPWRDEVSLWTAVRREDPLNPRAYEGLGKTLGEQGHLSRAERELTVYGEFQPLDGKVHVELADLFRRLRDVLEPATRAAVTETDVEAKRREVVRKEIEERLAAAKAWEKVGLVRGRGSESMRRRNLLAWRDAALLLEDGLLEAKRVNDRLAEDDVARTGAVEPTQGDVRVLLAGKALTPPPLSPPRPDDPEGPERYRERERLRREATAPARAAVLTDVGIDPSVSDPTAARALLPALDAVVARHPSEVRWRWLRASVSQRAYEDLSDDAATPYLSRLRDDLRALVAADPSNASARAALEELERRLGGRGPR